MNAQEEVLELREELRKHNHSYYVLSKPTISDYDFDMKLSKLHKLEQENPFANFLDFWTVLLPIISNVEFFPLIIDGIADFLAIEEQPIIPNLIFDFIFIM